VSTGSSLADWAEPLLALGLGGTVVVALAGVVARCTRTGAAQRVVWQATVVGLALLLGVELTGLASGVTEWIRPCASDRVIDPPEIDQRVVREPLLDEQPAWLVARSDDDFPVSEEGNIGPESPISTEAPPAWWPGALWLAGTLVVAGRTCAARMLLTLLRRRQAPVTDPGVLALARDVAGRLGYRRRVRIVEARGLVSSAAFGILRPTLVLSAGFVRDFTPAQQEAMLAHELAHLAAHDPAWHFIAQFVTAILWWHPAAWWALAQFRSASERAADEASLVVSDGPGALAACLVHLGARLAERRSPGWLSMAGSGFRSGLGQRVERLLRLDGAARRPPGRIRLAIVLIVGPALLVAVSALSTAWARSPAVSEGEMPMKSAWKRSVAAVVFVAALGSADPAPGGEQPPSSGGGGHRSAGGAVENPGAAGSGTKTEKKLEDQTRELRDRQSAVAAELNAVIERVVTIQDPNQAKDRDAQKLRDQLRDLGAKAKELEEIRSQLEQQLKALDDKKARDEKKAASTTRIKVFRMKHRDASEVSAVLTELLPRTLPTLPHPVHGFTGGGGMTGGGPGMGGGAGMMGGGGMAGGGMAGGGKGAMAGGMMGGESGAKPGAGGMKGGAVMMGMQGQTGATPAGMGGMGRPATSWRLAVDERTNSLVVRGTDDDLRTIGDIIAALDVPESKTATKLKNLRTFKLKHADVNQVGQIVQELALDVKASVLPTGNVLAVHGSEAALKDVADLIEELDVEGKSLKDVKPKQ
jgi:beta-lactamase regulating signal transducer with metallopeptidase domain